MNQQMIHEQDDLETELFLAVFTKAVAGKNTAFIKSYFQKGGQNVNRLYRTHLPGLGLTAISLLQLVVFLAATHDKQQDKYDDRYAKAIKFLYDCGAEIDAVDFYGNTALALATLFNKHDLICQLGMLGADPNIPNDKLKTCLHELMDRDWTDVQTKTLRVLFELKKKPDVTCMDENGFVPLHYARTEREVNTLLKHDVKKAAFNTDPEIIQPEAYIRERGFGSLADMVSVQRSAYESQQLQQLARTSTYKAKARL